MSSTTSNRALPAELLNLLLLFCLPPTFNRKNSQRRYRASCLKIVGSVWGIFLDSNMATVLLLQFVSSTRFDSSTTWCRICPKTKCFFSSWDTRLSLWRSSNLRSDSISVFRRDAERLLYGFPWYSSDGMFWTARTSLNRSRISYAQRKDPAKRVIG